MRRTRAWTALVAGSATAIALGLAAVPAAGAAPHEKPVAPPASTQSDMREVTPQGLKGLTLDQARSRADLINARRAGVSKKAPQVGDRRVWPALDDYEGTYYFKTFVLRAVAPHLQVWVANDRAFPTNDCRNDLGLTEVTQKQINNFKREFTDNIYKTESKVFSVPPAIDGSQSIAGDLGLPSDYWKVGKGQADDIVTLVDNVRDAAYYDPTSPDGQTFIGGFFSPSINFFTDRNVMTIDSYDWLHRTGANPPDNAGQHAYRQCARELHSPDPSKFGRARPFDYEGTFAHEYQHLLESYEDPDEVSWVNEGVSDWAQTLTGYVDPRIDVASPDADGHMACFSGFLGRAYGGAANSLTLWEDQGGPEVLCDYGAAYSFMEYLQSHWGDAIMKKLHRINANGLAGLDKALDAVGAKPSAMAVLKRWTATVALDKALDQNGGELNGGNAAAFQAQSLRFHIKWKNPQNYNDDGVFANGSDYVRLVGDDGNPLSASQVSSIDFTGADTAQPYDVEWTVDSTPPDEVGADEDCDTPPAAGTGGPALYSGCGDDFDRSIVREVTLPSGSPQLSFSSLWDMEPGWDFGMVQISDDGGKTWSSLETEDTTTAHDPAADPNIVSKLPGLNGTSDGWQTETADLSDYAGKTVLIGFRYMTDAASAESGWWIRDVTVAGDTFPNTLDGWETMTQAYPPKARWFVQLVAYGAKGSPVWRHTLPLSAKSGSLSDADVADAIGSDATTVAAIVTRLDPTETQDTLARYRLQVNGVDQPGSAGCGVFARC